MGNMILSVFALTGAMLAGSTVASAASVDMHAPAAQAPAAKLAIANEAGAQPSNEPGQAGQSGQPGQTGQASPPPRAKPLPKSKQQFFGLPLIGLFAAGGAGIALAAGSGTNPASP